MPNLPQTLKTVNFDGLPVAFTENGYLNATMIAKHYGKRVKDYLRNERTQDYIRALDEHLSEAVKTASVENSEALFGASVEKSDGINLPSEQNQLVIVVKGGKSDEQGTWLHPKLAIDFARWLNPRFAVWCDLQIEQMVTGSVQSLTAQITQTSLTLEYVSGNLSNAGRYLVTHGKKTKPQLKAKLAELLIKAQPFLPFVELKGE